MRAFLPIVFLASAGWSSVVSAAAPAASGQQLLLPKTDVPVISINTTMTEIGALMSGLLSEKVLADPDAALQRLEQLDQRFRLMEPHTGDRGPAFRISWQTMVEQIGRARDAVDAGTATPDTLSNLVHGIASACAGCHTQDDKAQVLSFGRLTPASGDPLQQARYHYITRDYADALRLYESWLDTQPRLSWNGPVLDAFEGELTIYAQIYRDPDRAIKALKQRLDRSGAGMSKQVRKDIQAWIKGFEDVRKAKLKAFEPGIADLDAYARKYILPHAGVPIATEEKDKIALLWLRGLVYEYVQAHPADARMPELLYWLSVVDRVLDYNFYYSLADLYLRECITRYPTSDTAELCYDEYERYVEFAYSGSSGEFVPAEVRDELLRLRDILDAAHAATEVPAGAVPATP
ncbi:MAG: hypothetical protein ACOY3X_02125 [Pseudomonadota bacterium]